MNIYNKGLWSLPNRIKKDIFIFSLPLFLASATRSDHQFSWYWTAFIGACFSSVPMSSKKRMICSSILFIFQTFYSKAYFFCLGFSIAQAYNNNILKTKQKEVTVFITRLEILGWLCSEIVSLPKIIKLILGSISLFIAFICDPPCVESNDPFDEMKKRIDSMSLVNIEYRQFINGNNANKKFVYTGLKPFLFEILYTVGQNKILILFCSFFSCEVTDYLIFLIGTLGILDLKWELLTLLLKGSATSNVYFRILSTFVLVVLISVIQSLFENDVNGIKEIMRY